MWFLTLRNNLKGDILQNVLEDLNLKLKNIFDRVHLKNYKILIY